MGTIQELLGHEDVKKTIYSHVMNRGDRGIRLRSGWFSERDACYLASGKPVVAQDTGFSNILPTGEGLFGIRTLEEAAAAVDAINSNYERHCIAARGIAEEYFDAAKVAARLISDVTN